MKVLSWFQMHRLVVSLVASSSMVLSASTFSFAAQPHTPATVTVTSGTSHDGPSTPTSNHAPVRRNPLVVPKARINDAGGTSSAVGSMTKLNNISLVNRAPTNFPVVLDQGSVFIARQDALTISTSHGSVILGAGAKSFVAHLDGMLSIYNLADSGSTTVSVKLSNGESLDVPCQGALLLSNVRQGTFEQVNALPITWRRVVSMGTHGNQQVFQGTAPLQQVLECAPQFKALVSSHRKNDVRLVNEMLKSMAAQEVAGGEADLATDQATKATISSAQSANESAALSARAQADMNSGNYAGAGAAYNKLARQQAKAGDKSAASSDYHDAANAYYYAGIDQSSNPNSANRLLAKSANAEARGEADFGNYTGAAQAASDAAQYDTAAGDKKASADARANSRTYDKLAVRADSSQARAEAKSGNYTDAATSYSNAAQTDTSIGKTKAAQLEQAKSDNAQGRADIKSGNYSGADSSFTSAAQNDTSLGLKKDAEIEQAKADMANGRVSAASHSYSAESTAYSNAQQMYASAGLAKAANIAQAKSDSAQALSDRSSGNFAAAASSYAAAAQVDTAAGKSKLAALQQTRSAIEQGKADMTSGNFSGAASSFSSASQLYQSAGKDKYAMREQARSDNAQAKGEQASGNYSAAQTSFSAAANQYAQSGNTNLENKETIQSERALIALTKQQILPEKQQEETDQQQKKEYLSKLLNKAAKMQSDIGKIQTAYDTVQDASALAMVDPAIIAAADATIARLTGAVNTLNHKEIRLQHKIGRANKAEKEAKAQLRQYEGTIRQARQTIESAKETLRMRSRGHREGQASAEASHPVMELVASGGMTSQGPSPEEKQAALVQIKSTCEQVQSVCEQLRQNSAALNDAGLTDQDFEPLRGLMKSLSNDLETLGENR